MIVAGNQSPFLLTEWHELRLPTSEVPALTLTAEPYHSVEVSGGDREEWKLRLRGEGEGETEAEARHRAQLPSLVRAGGMVSSGPTGSMGTDTYAVRATVFVDAPAAAPLVIHASNAPVELRDMTGPVRVTATRARAKLLNTSGRVDVVGSCIDVACARGTLDLSADAEINLKLLATRFGGTLRAEAQRSIRVLTPPGFQTPFRAVVARRADFICRADFASQIVEQKIGPAYYFTYEGDRSAAPPTVMHLHSRLSTVVMDTH